MNYLYSLLILIFYIIIITIDQFLVFILFYII